MDEEPETGLIEHLFCDIEWNDLDWVKPGGELAERGWVKPGGE